jgi:hypothetical protein
MRLGFPPSRLAPYKASTLMTSAKLGGAKTVVVARPRQILFGAFFDVTTSIKVVTLLVRRQQFSAV